jgi:hypothetical protein
MLSVQLDNLSNVEEVKADFNSEMSRFLPNPIKLRTLNSPDYWPYLQSEINQLAQILLLPPTINTPFDMSM